MTLSHCWPVPSSADFNFNRICLIGTPTALSTTLGWTHCEAVKEDAGLAPLLQAAALEDMPGEAARAQKGSKAAVAANQSLYVYARLVLGAH